MPWRVSPCVDRLRIHQSTRNFGCCLPALRRQRTFADMACSRTACASCLAPVVKKVAPIEQARAPSFVETAVASWLFCSQHSSREAPTPSLQCRARRSPPSSTSQPRAPTGISQRPTSTVPGVASSAVATMKTLPVPWPSPLPCLGLSLRVATVRLLCSPDRVKELGLLASASKSGFLNRTSSSSAFWPTPKKPGSASREKSLLSHDPGSPAKLRQELGSQM